jgi:para-nitrobenzyl esterase
VFAHVTGDASQFENRDRTLSQAIAGAWVQFAKTGSPNRGDLPKWPPYRSPEYKVLEYGDEVTVQSNAQKPEVEFFRRTFETMRARK